MSSKPVREFLEHFSQGTNMAENTEFVREYDVKYFRSNSISEISTVCKLKKTDKKFHWSSLNDVALL